MTNVDTLVSNEKSEILFRVALVGCGVISKNHLVALSELPFCKVVALCDILPERAEGRKREFSLDAEIYTDYETMLREVKPDAVHVCTPHYLHAPMTISALEKNIHVLLEKPMATSDEEIDAILAAERKSKAKLTVSFQNRTNASAMTAKKIAEDDGGILTAYGAVFWQRTPEYYVTSGWRGKRATEGGGVMINQAIHTIDLLCYYLGIPKKVIASTANHHLKGVIDVEDSCEGVILFENGRQANFYATTSFQRYDSTEVFLVTKNHKIEIRDPRVYVDGVCVLEKPEGAAQFVGKECYGNGHRSLVAGFYNAIIHDTPVPVSAESAQYALRVLLAAYRSNDELTDIPEEKK